MSIVDFNAIVEKPTTKDALNELFIEAQGQLRYPWRDHGEYGDPLVSMDFKGDCALRLSTWLPICLLVEMVKVVAWYDNEWGYSAGRPTWQN